MYKTILSVILASLLLLVPMSANAAKGVLSFERNGMRITLTHKPCTNPMVISLFQMNGIDPKTFYAGTVSLVAEPKKKPTPLCYAVNPADANDLFLVDEEGNYGPMSLVEPKKAPGL